MFASAMAAAATSRGPAAIWPCRCQELKERVDGPLLGPHGFLGLGFRVKGSGV